jgi:hypothetical protein
MVIVEPIDPQATTFLQILQHFAFVWRLETHFAKQVIPDEILAPLGIKLAWLDLPF